MIKKVNTCLKMDLTKKMVVGIDFGTAYVTVGYYLDGSVQVMETIQGTPSTLAFVWLTEKTENAKVGSVARMIALKEMPHQGIYGNY